MKQIFVKGLLLAGSALLTVSSAFAQKEKEKTKEEKSQDLQTIVITRNENTGRKTVIEIDGDKIKVNGKDARDSKDVHVNVNTIKDFNGKMNLYNHTPVFNSWDFKNNELLLSEDENHAMLGVTTEGNDKGAGIQAITRESAAEKAGLKQGDIITRIDDKKIETTDDVTEAVRAHKPGDTISIHFLREGKEQTATAELTRWKGVRFNAIALPQLDGLNREMEGFSEQWRNMSHAEPFNFNYNSGRPRLGLSIQDTEDGAGVKVLDVDKESAAGKAGIKEGDIIVKVDDTEVKETEDVVKATRASKEKTSYQFKVNRNGSAQTLQVKIPRKLKTADL